MANFRRQPVSFRPFRADPLLAEGLLGVERPGGELERQVADAFFRIAGEQRAKAQEEAARKGERAGLEAALGGRPGSTTIEGGGMAQGAPIAAGDGLDQAKGLLRKFEGFRGTPYWDVNAFRTGYGSDTITRPDGSVVKVAQGMSISREDGERDLDRRVREFASRAGGQVGADTWSKLPPNVQAGLTSVTYNYGSLPAGVVRAVKSGDLSRVADAVQSLKANPERRRQEAEHIKASTAGTAGVAPSVQAPKISAAGASGFRPSGKRGAFWESYDAAGTRTYLQLLETKILDETEQVYRKFKDDPVALAQGLDDLKRVQLEDDVFPEIQAEYEIAYGRRASGYMRQAQRDMEIRAEKENRAAFLGRVGELEEQRSRDLVAFDPENPDTSAALMRTQKALDDHYDAAVLHGIMDEPDAARAKAASRRETAIGYYTAQTASKSADEVAAMRQEMRESYAAGELDDVDAEGWARIETKLATIERAKRADDRRAASALEKRAGEFVDRATSGYGIDPAEVARFRLDGATAPGGPAIVQRTEKILAVADLLKEAPIAEARDQVAKLRAGLGATPDADAIAVVEAADAMIEKAQKSLDKDLISHAERAGVIEPTGELGGISDPADVAATIAQRIDAGEKAADHYGVPARFFKAGEAAAIEKTVRADPERGAEIAGAIVSGAGARVRDVLAEFGGDAPMMAEAGAILAFGGSARAAEDVIGGYGKGLDGKQLKGLKADHARQSASATIGSSLALAPQDRQRIERAAAAIARKRISEEGLDPASEEAIAIHGRAVHEAAGAVFDRGVQYGGFVDVDLPGWLTGTARVLVDPSIRADRFEELLAAIRDEDLAGLPVKPKPAASRLPGTRGSLSATLQKARPVAVSGGYAFALGDPAGDDPQFVQGDDGRIFVLNLAALKAKLAPRVPGGFR